jgi:polysaccharide biosynthesis PFTS motif protein
MAHKIKRKNESTHKGYLQSIKKLKEQSNYIEINVNSDATTVVKHTKACISMPFTSTALIAKYEGKPSIYYDPSGIIQKNDRAAHGIPVLSNIDELEEWVKSIGNE